MELSRAEFLGGVAAGMVASLFGLSLDEAQAAVLAGVDESKDDTLTFVVGGTQREPRIRVEGVITAMEITANHETQDVFAGGQVVGRYMVDHSVSITTRQPFRVRFEDSYLEGVK